MLPFDATLSRVEFTVECLPSGTESLGRDYHAESRVLRKRFYDEKLLIGGCRACLSDLEINF